MNLPSVDLQKIEEFEAIVRANSRMTLVYLRSIVSDHVEVDDLYQETMMVAWHRFDDCDLTRPLGPWFRGIASRLVMAHYRKKKKLPALLDANLLEQIDERFESIESGSNDDWEQQLHHIDQCIDQLPQKYQHAIQVRYLNNASAKVAAETLGISAEACKKRLQRARQRIAECLKRKGLLASEGVMP